MCVCVWLYGGFLYIGLAALLCVEKEDYRILYYSLSMSVILTCTLTNLQSHNGRFKEPLVFSRPPSPSTTNARLHIAFVTVHPIYTHQFYNTHSCYISSSSILTRTPPASTSPSTSSLLLLLLLRFGARSPTIQSSMANHRLHCPSAFSSSSRPTSFNGLKYVTVCPSGKSYAALVRAKPTDFAVKR